MATHDSPTSAIHPSAASEPAVLEGGAAAEPRPLPPRLADARVGPYHLLRILGEGGFGVVYLAERREPFVQAVALKVLKPGMDSKAILNRFELERQALALMDHPGIARVLDGGMTDEGSRLGPGRPYFVMELVSGESITDYCRTRALPISARLELFLAICDAVQHAHTKGVIHRDLKPSNILVSEVGGKAAPKVIDFGVAKAISVLRPDQTMTVTGQFIGTPEYMSPEQAGGGGEREDGGGPADIDTRADVYSLGVILYRLLTGVLPFEPDELWKRGLLETMRVIREVEPPKPSTRVATVSRTRTNATAAEGATVVAGGAAGPGPSGLHPLEPPDTLARKLRGDLDWICMRALEKARERRYQSPGALAADIRRHLRTEPVEAGPPGLGYRAGKFVRRNRALVLGSSIAVAALVAGLIFSLFSLAEARTQRAIAEQRREQAEANLAAAERQQRIAEETLGFVEKAMFLATPSTGGDIMLLDLVRTLAANLFDGTNKAPAESRPSLLFQTGKLLRSFEDFKGAERCLSAAREESLTLGARGQFDHWRSSVMLAMLRNDQNRPADALALIDEVREAIERSATPDAAPLLLEAETTRGTALQKLGRKAEAADAFRGAIALAEARIGESSGYTINPMLGLSSILTEDPATRAEALELAERALALCESRPQSNDLLIVSACNAVARARRDKGDLAGAAELYQRVIALSKVVYPFPPATLAATQHNLALILRELGRPGEARALIEDALATRRKLVPDSVDVARSLDVLAGIEADAENLARAEELYRQELDIAAATDVGNGLEAARAQTGLADVLCRREKFEPARRLAEKALSARRRSLAPGDWPIFSTQSVLAAALAGLGEFEKADTLFQESLVRLEADPATTPGRLRPVLRRGVDLYTRSDRPDRAAALQERLRQLDR